MFQKQNRQVFLFVFINFVVDLLYVWVDPRIRIIGREA